MLPIELIVIGARADSAALLAQSATLSIRDFGAAEVHAGHPPFSAIRPVGARSSWNSNRNLRCALSRIFARACRSASARLAGAPGGNVRERHVEHAPAIVELARCDAEVRVRQPARFLSTGSIPSRSSLSISPVMPRCFHRLQRHLDLQHLDHVDRRKAAADHDRARSQLVARTVVACFQVMIEPVNQRVLIDQAAIDELVRALDRKRRGRATRRW